MTLTDLEKRLEDLEGETHTHGERPRELTKEEREILDEHFDVEPFADTDTDTDLWE